MTSIIPDFSSTTSYDVNGPPRSGVTLLSGLLASYQQAITITSSQQYVWLMGYSPIYFVEGTERSYEIDFDSTMYLVHQLTGSTRASLTITQSLENSINISSPEEIEFIPVNFCRASVNGNDPEDSFFVGAYGFNSTTHSTNPQFVQFPKPIKIEFDQNGNQVSNFFTLVVTRYAEKSTTFQFLAGLNARIRLFVSHNDPNPPSPGPNPGPYKTTGYGIYRESPSLIFPRQGLIPHEPWG